MIIQNKYVRQSPQQDDLTYYTVRDFTLVILQNKHMLKIS